MNVRLKPVLFHISWLSALYFILLCLNTYVIKSDFVLIGVVQELITIPIILGQFVIAVVSAISWVKEDFGKKGYVFWTFLISLCNSLFVVGSFLGWG